MAIRRLSCPKHGPGFSFAHSCGTVMFGEFTPAISTYLIHATGNRAIPGLWLSFAAAWGLIATALLRSSRVAQFSVMHEHAPWPSQHKNGYEVFGRTASLMRMTPSLKIRARRPPRWIRLLITPCCVRSSKCLHGSQRRVPRMSTEPTQNSRSTR